MKRTARSTVLAGIFSLAPFGCDEAESTDEETQGHGDADHDHDHDHDHNEENEVITTATLTFRTEAGDVVTATFRDADGDGGESATIGPINLVANTRYSVSLTLLNEFTNEEVTEEIAEEAEEHFVFFYGADVAGPSSSGRPFLLHEFDDVESDYAENNVGDDLPVGLASVLTTTEAGAGELAVLVRHLPDINDAAQKTAELPDMFARGEPLPGSNDVDITFQVTVD